MVRYYTFLITVLSMAVLSYCAYKAGKSDKPIAGAVHNLLLSMLPTFTGVAVTIYAKSRIPAEIGYYLYYIGINVLVAYLISFSFRFCNVKQTRTKGFYVLNFIVLANVVQIFLNPFFGNMFTTQAFTVGGADYYRRIPNYGHYLHLVVICLCLGIVVFVFTRKIIASSRIYVERYVLVLISIVMATAWESLYYVANTPLDTSSVGFLISGLLIYYFSLHYTPVFLLSNMLQGIASELPEYLYFFDEDGNCIWANSKGMKFLGLKDNELQNVRSAVEARFPQISDQDEAWCGIQSEGDKEDLHYYVIESHLNTDAKYKDRVNGKFLSIRDTTEEQRNLSRERYNARHDSLTGLFNKEYLYKRIEKELKENPDIRYEVSYVDVNEFKLVNDVFGREFGDQAIKQIAEWIAKDMPEHTLYGRLGGDTFGVCQPADWFDPERINKALSDFVVKQGNIEHHVLIQIGVYEIEDNDIDVSIMFDRARLALRSIKRTYSHIAYYDNDIRARILHDQMLSAELEGAITERQIRPYLQPIVDTEGRVKGAEALVRWIHPKMGFMPPDEFIPVFEQNGLIVDVDRYMWRCAGEILNEWKVTHPDFFMSINISPIDFYFMDIEEVVNSITEDFDIDPAKLRLEITESVMMTNMDERVRVIDKLREAGHIIEMDDFGSGYSSFNMLKDIPADLIKLDQMFLKNAGDNEKARIILERVIKMIDNLGMVSLTEGVETEKQFRALTEMGCKLFQGYYFSKPLPREEFEAFCNKAAAE